MNEKGISLIALVVTIIVMIILATIVIKVGNDGFTTATNAQIANEIRDVESAAMKRFSDNAVSETAYPLLGEKIELETAITTICSNTEYTDADIRESLTKNISYVRKINSTDINGLGVKNATGNLYIVDYFSGKVYGPIK